MRIRKDLSLASVVLLLLIGDALSDEKPVPVVSECGIYQVEGNVTEEGMVLEPGSRSAVRLELGKLPAELRKYLGNNVVARVRIDSACDSSCKGSWVAIEKALSPFVSPAPFRFPRPKPIEAAPCGQAIATPGRV